MDHAASSVGCSSTAGVTNFGPVLDHFFETHPGYIPLIDERVPGTWSRRDHEGRQPSGAASRG
jgi:hypothetical protein